MAVTSFKLFLDRAKARIPDAFQLPLRNALIAGVVVALYLISLPNQYTSTGRILPGESRGGSGMAAAAAAATGVSLPGTDSVDATYLDIMNSDWLRTGLLGTTFEFKVRSWYLGAAHPRKESLYAYLKCNNYDQGIRAVGKMLTVNRDIKTKLLTIKVETTSPELSQQIVQKAIGLLNGFVVDKSKARGGNKAKFAEERLADARRSQTRAEESFRNFLERNRSNQLSSDPSVRLEGARLEAEWKLHQQVVTTLAIAWEQALLDEKNDVPIVNVLDVGRAPQEKSGPPRSLLILMSMMLALGGSWVWWNKREWVMDLLPGKGK